MAQTANPALSAFVAKLATELLIAQVLIHRRDGGFELRHIADRNAALESLPPVELSELRALAQTTAAGAFRPLKSAPNLRSGWRFTASSVNELGAALDRLYPGAVADWFAAQSSAPPITSFREYTERQTGMYRITAMLTDEQAAKVIRACCHVRFCLKRRLWSVAGLAPDTDGQKSIIPCLEPCAMFLEFARTAMRIEQEEKGSVQRTPGEAAALHADLEARLARLTGTAREGDMGDADNPRRLQLMLEKLEPADRCWF